MSLNKIVINIFLMFCLVSSVFAGTLTSGAKVDITSTNPELGKNNLLVTWSTTPATGDKLYIDNSNLPPSSGAQLPSQIAIDIAQPTIEQVMNVVDQQQVYKLDVVPKWYFYYLFPWEYTEAAMMKACEDKISADTSIVNVLEGTYVLKKPTPVGCDAVYVQNTLLKGYVGNLENAGVNYREKITVDKFGTIELVKDETKNINNLVSEIPGVGRATLLGFSNWLVSPLSTENVIVYQYNDPATVSKWNVQTKSGKTAILQSSFNKVVSNFKYKTTPTSVSDFVLMATSDVNAYNTEVDNIVGNLNNYPSQWVPMASSDSLRRYSNSIAAPLTSTVYTANIQLLLSGDKIGLFIPTGVPTIKSVDSPVKFDEKAIGTVNYVAKNSGQAQGSFSASVVCDNSAVTATADDFTIDKGQESARKLSIFGKTADNKDIQTSCTLSLRETNTPKSSNNPATVRFQVNVLAKAGCNDGQQNPPREVSGGFVVDTVDRSCTVKSTSEICPSATKQFNVVDGKWVCQTKSSATNGGDKGGQTLNTTLLTVAVILGLILAGIMYPTYKTWTITMPPQTKKIVLWVLVIVTIALGMYLTSVGYKFLVELFPSWVNV